MDTRKIFHILIGMNIIQIGLSILLIIILIEKTNVDWTLIVLAVIAFTMFNGLLTVVSFNCVHRMKNTYLVESMKNLEQLNTTLRAQRHDYLNHMQVVYGLIELEEFEEAKKYIRPVFEEMSKVSLAMKTALPAINALLQAKMQMAEKKEIEMSLAICTDLKQIKIEPWELCKVLANIIDNAMTALDGVNGKKKIHIEMIEQGAKYKLSVTNNGPAIPKEKLETIFEKGYTTKKEGGYGMGLFIVKQILDKNRGHIQVISNREATCFSIFIDKMSVEG